MRRKIYCAMRYASANGMTVKMQKIAMMPRMRSAQEKTQKTVAL
jgi:hypothetical protein